MTTSPQVLHKLQSALEEFLADHRKNAPKMPDWTAEDKLPTNPGDGCGCEDCATAGQLLGSAM